MTSYFTQKAPQAENRWLLPLLPSILADESRIATVDPQVWPRQQNARSPKMVARSEG